MQLLRLGYVLSRHCQGGLSLLTCIYLNFSYVDIEEVDFSCTCGMFTIEHVNAYSKTLNFYHVSWENVQNAKFL